MKQSMLQTSEKSNRQQRGHRPARSLLDRVWRSVANAGRAFATIPPEMDDPLDRAKALARALLTARGEASGAAIAQELVDNIEGFTPEQRRAFLVFVAEDFQVDETALAEAARVYLAAPDWQSAAALSRASEPPRQELLRRMNMAGGGTRLLVALRAELGAMLSETPVLAALNADMRHLFASWFNRGFLELRQIDWQTPAAILEKLIAYEAVHEIQGWDDLRRRLAPDRRCFAFFHPALPDEPLIFVEVALVAGLAGSVRALLERGTGEAEQRRDAADADTAIFYSISNCQEGLRSISFGNFLIKQVVEILRFELPGLELFATLSPAPGFRRWLDQQLADATRRDLWLSAEEHEAVLKLARPGWETDIAATAALRPILSRLCALYLATPPVKGRKVDPVARFHLGNGARLERINWMGNPGKRGMQESWGMMVNYLYDPAMIEANHEAFTRAGEVARAPEIDALLRPPMKRGKARA